eukprot:CAMPEP_0197287878 /NCGR_PEP_ID=MMETSP0890-20130614/4700_1 /TAXON_ID=44058 ORGANISM="Aureoumbra lagunensis, Strain CCMP1510" /NCGR_SAMPLE_ID=MMETSP0890 /ASSEMBLY_ACC=CAM_ASM_000533 /LENGTH=181 /DNA_ID=CAMNT_0042758105 /DNA_START=41 /DNA_END=587 /DNA_ORIENTATION=-
MANVRRNSDSDDEELRGVPAGVLSKVATEKLKQSRAFSVADESKRETTTYAPIVDQSQFRNIEVGVGYQAKGVIRQPGLTRLLREAGDPGLIAMTREESSREQSDKKKKKRKKAKYKKKHSKKKHTSQDASHSDTNDETTSSFKRRRFPSAQALDADNEKWVLSRRLARLEELLTETQDIS